MTISVPATSANLGPGLDTLGLSLDFRNESRITPATHTSVRIYGEGENIERFRANNMFVKIFHKTLKDLDVPKQHFEFVFSNKIPISRGMGSSSAIIIGAISAAYCAAKLPIDKEKILHKALVYEHHPDNITPATFGGFNVATVEPLIRGNAQNIKSIIYHLHSPIPSFLRAVMVIPDKSTSTKYSRQCLPKRYTSYETIHNVSHASLLTMAFMQEKWDFLRIASIDKLHQDRRMKQFPILFQVQKFALENGALMSTLSGSGSSFLNICHEDDVCRIQKVLADKFNRFRVVSMGFDNKGLITQEN